MSKLLSNLSYLNVNIYYENSQQRLVRVAIELLLSKLIDYQKYFVPRLVRINEVLLYVQTLILGTNIRVHVYSRNYSMIRTILLSDLFKKQM